MADIMLVIPMSSQIALTIPPYLYRDYSFDLNKEHGNTTKRLKLSRLKKSLIIIGTGNSGLFAEKSI